MGDQPFPITIERDRVGSVRRLRHLLHPFSGSGIDPALPRREREQRLIVAYLRAVGRLFTIKMPLLPEPVYVIRDEQIDHLERTIGSSAPATQPGVWFRWAEGDRSPRLIRGGESAVWWVRQTHYAAKIDEFFDVWQSGLRFVVHNDPFRITSSASTVLGPLSTSIEKSEISRELKGLQALQTVILNAVGIEIPLLVLEKAPRVVYRVKPEDLQSPDSPTGISKTAVVKGAVAKGAKGPIPPPDEDDRIVDFVEYDEPETREGKRPYRLFSDSNKKEMLYAKILATNVASPVGSVFARDPRTVAGRGAPPPGAASDELEDYVAEVALPGIPAAQGNGKLRLKGRLIDIRDPAGDDGGPVEPAPFAFDYPPRTDEFAAVSAYVHCHAVFARLEEFGFDLSEFFAAGQFPLPVRPRSQIVPGPCTDGKCINAQVRQAAGGNRIAEFRFALGDLCDVDNRLGSATDLRWVWHEFCHALLIAATWFPEFPFAHSAGDSLAAIDSDPESLLSSHGRWRGVTFPWIAEPMRRHDRRASDGWGWYGRLYEALDYPSLDDPGGYRAEQVLSSTLFRLYRTAGGDSGRPESPHVAARRDAADYVIYLIVRAIAQLGDSGAVPALDPADFALAMMEADVATVRFSRTGHRERPGGTLHKVIRWAFETQGLYQPMGAEYPQDGPGAPEKVDVYIEDETGRAGAYDYTDHWAASPSAMWVRAQPDGLADDQAPDPGQANFVYVVVSNRGSESADDTEVQLFAHKRNAVRTWPDGWDSLKAASGAVTRATIAPGIDTRFGPFEWPVPTSGEAALLAVASTAGDPANIDVTGGLACAAGPTRIVDLVPNDNNLGFRRWKL